MKELAKLNTVCSEMDQNNMEILGIYETNYTNKGSFRTHDNQLIIFAGKDERDGYSHGVVTMSSKEKSTSLLGYSPISDRLIELRIQGKLHNKALFSIMFPQVLQVMRK